MPQTAVLCKVKLAKAIKSVTLSIKYIKKNNVFHNVHWPGVWEAGTMENTVFAVFGEGGSTHILSTFDENARFVGGSAVL